MQFFNEKILKHCYMYFWYYDQKMVSFVDNFDDMLS